MSSRFDLADFQADVIDRSRDVPVLVDFWAAWCGPCKMLGPVLEKLADEAAGRWTLVKIDTERHPALAAQFSIRGIPDVRLFHGGVQVAQFSGAMPEPALRRWLEEHLPSPAREALRQANDLLASGQFAEAERLLTPLFASNTADREIGAALARAVVFRDPETALACAQALPPADAELVRSLALVLRIRPADLPENPARTPLLAGLAELRAGRFPEALRLLLAAMEEDRRYADAAAKRASLAVFKHLGPHHPITLEFHRRYSMAAT